MGNADDKVDHDNLELCFGDEILICTDGMYNEYPIDYLIESIRMDKLDIEKKMIVLWTITHLYTYCYEN